MAIPSDLSLDAQIALVEERMALRRARIAGNVVDARAEASRVAQRATRWLPVAGVAGALAVGFVLARHRRTAPSAAVRAFSRTSAPLAPPVARGALATVIALAAGALRFAMSVEGRMAWRAFQAARAHAQRRRFSRRRG